MDLSTAQPSAPSMEMSEALTLALRLNGMRDEEAAVQASVSVYTVQSIRLGRVKRPQRLVREALRRVVPGFAGLCDGTAAIVDGKIVDLQVAS